MPSRNADLPLHVELQRTREALAIVEGRAAELKAHLALLGGLSSQKPG